MGMLSRLREAGARFIARRIPAEAMSFSAEIPGSRGPLWRLRMEMAASPQAGGQMLRLRAHWRLSLRNRDLSSWMELRASDAALDEGSGALVPGQLAELGIQPRADQPVQSWAGEFRGARPGFGILSLMRLDKRQLPAWLQRRLGRKPFQMAATVATAVEDSTP